MGDTELKLSALAAGEQDKELTELMLALRTEETALAQRAQTVWYPIQI